MKKSIKLCSVRRQLFINLLRDEVVKISQIIPKSQIWHQYRIAQRNINKYFWQWLNENISLKTFAKKCLSERNSLWAQVEAFQ